VVLVFPARRLLGAAARLAAGRGAAAVRRLPLALALQPNRSLRVIKLAALLVTSILFLYTRNFWLCWLVHAALVVVFTPAVLHSQRLPGANAPT
jgi:hypothetical protein